MRFHCANDLVLARTLERNIGNKPSAEPPRRRKAMAPVTSVELSMNSRSWALSICTGEDARSWFGLLLPDRRCTQGCGCQNQKLLGGGTGAWNLASGSTSALWFAGKASCKNFAMVFSFQWTKSFQSRSQKCWCLELEPEYWVSAPQPWLQWRTTRVTRFHIDYCYASEAQITLSERTLGGTVLLFQNNF